MPGPGLRISPKTGLGEYVEIGPARLQDAELLEAIRSGPVPPAILFVPVPDARTVKNRLHFDLTPIDSSQADEVARLESLGARRVGRPRGQRALRAAQPRAG
jgi:hypothetical protein